VPCRLQCRHCGTWVADETSDFLRASAALFQCVHGVAHSESGVSPLLCPSLLHAQLFSSTHRAGTSTTHTVQQATAGHLPQSTNADGGVTTASVAQFLRAVAPRLDGKSHKGQAGRVGVVGGSGDYTGAPYFTGISALRIGAELVSIYTADTAAVPIKTYSPELMVTAVYSDADMAAANPANPAAIAAMVDRVASLLPRLHVLAIGPGLGRLPAVLEAVAAIIKVAKSKELPIVIDADGLWLINQRPELVKGYPYAILTPNMMELRRLNTAVLGEAAADTTGSELAVALEGPIIVCKGSTDRVCTPDGAVLECLEAGALKRPGGLGDLLCGTIATIAQWAKAADKPLAWACVAACTVVRRACHDAFLERRRAFVAVDAIHGLSTAFEHLCPAMGEPDLLHRS
jgi:ATP-dependent NAD(P)H-hydrate dehydratase